MTDFNQVPGELNITVGLGDDLTLTLDFDIDLTGYTFSASVVSEFDGQATAFTYTAVNLSTGRFQISLTDTQVSALGKAIHKWYLIGTVGTVSRRYLAGAFEIKAYP
jgi:hypothetical protein